MSINIPAAEIAIVESLLWNFAQISQFFFRAIRIDSNIQTEVFYLTSEMPLENNLVNLIIDKSKVVDFI